MGSNPVTVVANSVHRHDQSIDLGICDLDTALWLGWNEAALRHAGNTSVVVFVEENSLRVLAVHLANVGLNITCQKLWENVRTCQLFTNDTTPRVYGKVMLVFAFDSSMRIITIPKMGVSCILDSIADKRGLVVEQNLKKHIGVIINPAAQFQLATYFCKFKMLNALDVTY